MLPVALVISTITLTLGSLDVRFSSQLLAAGVTPSGHMGRLFPFRCMTPHWLHHTHTHTHTHTAQRCNWLLQHDSSSLILVCLANFISTSGREILIWTSLIAYPQARFYALGFNKLRHCVTCSGMELFTQTFHRHDSFCL